MAVSTNLGSRALKQPALIVLLNGIRRHEGDYNLNKDARSDAFKMS